MPQNAHNATVLEDLLSKGVVGLKAFMSPAGTEDFDQSSVNDIKAAAASLSKIQRSVNGSRGITSSERCFILER